jgi:DNA-binding beta-propeller fold protein YncE
MNGTRLLLYLVLAVLVCVWAGPALAIDVVEAWRSPLGQPRSVSVDASDGSAWVAAASGILHIAADGTVLSQVGGLSNPFSVSPNPTDGSLWVIEFSDCWAGMMNLSEGTVVHLDQSGAEISRAPLNWAGMPDVVWGGGTAYAPAVNPVDGSCWVCDEASAQVVHLASDGTELWRGGDFAHGPRSISVNPAGNSVWASDGVSDVMHLAADGTELARVSGFEGGVRVAANPADGSCWVTHFGGGWDWVTPDEPPPGQVVHLDADGTELLRVGGFSTPLAVSVDPTDGSCWVALGGLHQQVVHVAEDGTELWRGAGFYTPRSVSVNPADGSCWVTDNFHVVHLSAEGEELWRSMPAFSRPEHVSVDAADGSCWVTDLSGTQVVHLNEEGAVLWRGIGADMWSGHPLSVSANPSDGSCWVGKDGGFDSRMPGTVHHLDSTGNELWAGSQFRRPLSLSVNPTDGSCWVGDHSSSGSDGSELALQVVRLAEDGTELWRHTEPRSFGAVSVNPTDGSGWVTAVDLVHFAEDGSELWRGSGFGDLSSVSVDSADGSCWVADCNNSAGVDPAGVTVPEDECGLGEVVRLAADGTELCRAGEFYFFAFLAADPNDGSCWVTSPCGGYVLLLAADGAELWRGEGFSHPMDVSVNPADGSCWVTDIGTAQVVHLVIVPFQDIPADFWAYDEVSACADAGIVGGYGDGTYDPSAGVDRAQMAVYIARALAGGEESVPEFAGAPTFPDVPEAFWALDHVEYAVAQNVVEGYEDGLYHPEFDVTRDQMAVYVARALVAPEGEAGLADYTPVDPRDFPDVPDTFWAYTAIEYCVESGVVQGYEDGYYHPEILVTRDQMAVYVARAFGLTT